MKFRSGKSIRGGLLVAGLVGASLAAPAIASDEYAISYSEKELSTFHGVRSVHERIVKAAKQYCPTYAQIRSHADVRTCVEGVVDDLVSKVAHPQLSSFHQDGESVRLAIMPTAEAPDRS